MSITQPLPQFSRINPKNIKAELTIKLNENRALIQSLLSNKPYRWETLIGPLEDMDVALHNYWSPISHMNNVVNTQRLRQAYDACLPLLTEYATEIGLNKDLYEAYQAIHDSPEFNDLSIAQKKVITDALRDFKLAGVALEGKDKEVYQSIQLKLAELSNKYEQNLMDSTDAWSMLVEDEFLLAGIPELAKQQFKQKAEEQEKSGWLITLDFPSYYAVITYAKDQILRKELYTAYCTRASDQGPHDKEFDNSNIIQEILSLRHEEAKLLGFSNFVDYSLAPKMASSASEVSGFLNELAEKSKPVALRQWEELKAFAKDKLSINELNAWDVAYASEKLKQAKHGLSQEELRPYFQVNHVIEGMFKVASKLYNIHINESLNTIDKWHEDVIFYEIHSKDKQCIAGFYLDLYARPKKRGGAWMDDCCSRHVTQQDDKQLPIAYLTCNFTPPLDHKPSLLTHQEVITLFHEFGHGLHHMLTQVDTVSVAGINGVAWDAVEFPSQFMENWCWQKPSLDLFAYHYETKEKLPEELFNQLIASKNFQSGMQMLRQLEFSLFDFRIHKEFDGTDQTQSILDDVRRKVGVVPVPKFNRFQQGFAHIFAGGYAAGYYSYKWAEVLASDAFSLFEQAGIFDPILGEKFLKCILEKGGSQEPMELFISFQGREPNVDALLRQSGII